MGGAAPLCPLVRQLKWRLALNCPAQKRAAAKQRPVQRRGPMKTTLLRLMGFQKITNCVLSASYLNLQQNTSSRLGYPKVTGGEMSCLSWILFWLARSECHCHRL